MLRGVNNLVDSLLGDRRALRLPIADVLDQDLAAPGPRHRVGFEEALRVVGLFGHEVRLGAVQGSHASGSDSGPCDTYWPMAARIDHVLSDPATRSPFSMQPLPQDALYSERYRLAAARSAPHDSSLVVVVAIL